MSERTNRISVSLSDSEKERIENAAKKSGLSATSFMRFVALKEADED